MTDNRIEHREPAAPLGRLSRIHLSSTPRGSAVAWIAIVGVASLASFFVTIVALGIVEQLVLRPLGMEPVVGTTGWGIRLAAGTVVWGVLVVGAIEGAARLLRIPLVWSPSAVAVLAVGIALGALTQLEIHEWAIVRLGVFNARYLGPTALAPEALVGVALAGCARRVAPASLTAFVRSASIAAAAPFAAILMLNLPGVADGVGSEALPLASTLLVDLGYVLMVASGGLRGPRHD
jgi:hypothetical protein